MRIRRRRLRSKWLILLPVVALGTGVGVITYYLSMWKARVLLSLMPSIVELTFWDAFFHLGDNFWYWLHLKSPAMFYWDIGMGILFAGFAALTIVDW